MFLFDPIPLNELPDLLLMFVVMLAYTGTLMAVTVLPALCWRAGRRLLTGSPRAKAELRMPLFAWIWMLGSLVVIGWLITVW